jgi:hydrogenase maturation protease
MHGGTGPAGSSPVIMHGGTGPAGSSPVIMHGGTGPASPDGSGGAGVHDHQQRGAVASEPESPPVLPVLVVGCGNLLRGDDALGPLLVRMLWERGVPEGVELVDGGTAGLDVAFKMRGRRKVVVVDAARTGARPGTVFRVPGSEVAELPPVTGLHQHAFRWDHALAVGRWLLKDAYPEDVVVVLVEIEQTEPGSDLSAAAQDGLERALAVVLDEVAG